MVQPLGVDRHGGAIKCETHGKRSSLSTSVISTEESYMKQSRWKEAKELQVPVIESIRHVLGLEHPDTLSRISNLESIYVNQGRWKEAKELQAQIIRIRMQVFVEFEDSDSSIEDGSVFSATLSIPSTRSLDSGRADINTLLVQGFATLLHEDDTVLSLLLLGRDRHTSRISDVIEVSNPEDEESDQDSVTEELGDDEPYEGSLQHLDQIKHLILQSTTYQILRHRPGEFVQPTLHSRLRDLVTRWSNPADKNHGEIARYNLWDLLTELRHVYHYRNKFKYDNNMSGFLRFTGHYQHIVERWTGERWDWWPLPRCPRNQRQGYGGIV
ncbi:hypothetical protein TSTA_116170 [Talaromyces stipitatus ATCC 10500]|uniref:Kinesin light chain n=1 Tax=Talaromyces stipitatus (strain ATCC 10500 / CBS 375.48 / QM 6759 / NRRL 1006) TaxID=441959 RepID=B8MBG3_TALSN|nr:uncharacterized protein TSTA_116170 [Talaromyces stipitatus ATCC 10500]EED17827.1 hypothetical protein TSTA_116170 [Talaromyces stipitatus ATCC 10500]